MYANSEFRRLKHLIISLVGIAVSGWCTLSEVNYAWRGQLASGTITKLTRSHEFNQRLNRKSVQKIDYLFTDSRGTEVNGQETVPISWDAPADGKIQIQYIPGSPATSRIAGRTNWIPIVAFVICLGWLGFALFQLWRKAGQTEPAPPVDRRKEPANKKKTRRRR